MKNTELKALIREEVKKALNEGAFDVTNDAKAIKALEDVAANMTKWKSSESAHYRELLNKVIEYLQNIYK
jgi:hypothetical protein